MRRRKEGEKRRRGRRALVSAEPQPPQLRPLIMKSRSTSSPSSEAATGAALRGSTSKSEASPKVVETMEASSLSARQALSVVRWRTAEGTREHQKRSAERSGAQTPRGSSDSSRAAAEGPWLGNCGVLPAPRRWRGRTCWRGSRRPSPPERRAGGKREKRSEE